MKKLICSVICLFMLCIFGVSAFADPEEQAAMARKYVQDAMAWEQQEEYGAAAGDYVQAAISIQSVPSYYAVAAYAYKLAAQAYMNDDNPSMAEIMTGCQQQYEGYAEARRNNGEELVDPSVFFGSGASSAGSTLSEGSIWAIIAIAIVVIGAVAALVIVKKKAIHNS